LKKARQPSGRCTGRLPFSLLCADGKSNRRGRGAPQLMDPEGQKKNPAAVEQSHTKFLIFAAQYDNIK
jgi:hypothetical protein